MRNHWIPYYTGLIDGFRIAWSKYDSKGPNLTRLRLLEEGGDYRGIEVNLGSGELRATDETGRKILEIIESMIRNAKGR